MKPLPILLSIVVSAVAIASDVTAVSATKMDGRCCASSDGGRSYRYRHYLALRTLPRTCSAARTAASVTPAWNGDSRQAAARRRVRSRAAGCWQPQSAPFTANPAAPTTTRRAFAGFCKRNAKPISEPG